jgi:hypothetical protein
VLSVNERWQWNTWCDGSIAHCEWVIWQWNTWRDGYITYCDVGDMTMDTRDIDMWQRQVEPKTWQIDTWHIDIVQRWVEPKTWHVDMWLIDL